MNRAKRPGTLKTLEKLEKCVQAGNYYEAQQMYKTVHARYMASKKYEEAMDLLQSGSSLQLKHGQVTCGVELGVLLIETFTKANLKFGSFALDQIQCIINKFPRVSSTEMNICGEEDHETSSEACLEARKRVEGFSTFVKTAIKWCIDSGGPSKGPPELYDALAQYIWTQSLDKDIGKVSLYFVRGNHPESYAAAMVDCLKQGDQEADLVVARGVLLYLSLGNLRDANRLLHEVKHGLKNQVFPHTSLMRFIRYLLLTLERDALPLFRMLRQTYRPCFERDSFLNECLDAIAERFYGVRRESMGGMFGDLLKMLVAGPNS